MAEDRDMTYCELIGLFNRFVTKNPEMPPETDKDFLVGMFKAYASSMGYAVSAEKVDGGVFELGRVRVERAGESGETSFGGRLCDCLVRPGSEADMVYSTLDRAFGDGEPVVHHFEKIGLGGVKSLSELALRLAAASAV